MEGRPESPEKSVRSGELLASRYRIESTLGQGGMGTVFRAYDTLLKSTIALKILNPAFSQSEDAVERFKYEVILARRFTHPNACRIYDLGETNGTFYVSMEYIDGQTLARLLIKKKRLSLDEGLPIMQQVLEAVAAAHAAGVVHRDLKPQNIMVSGSKAYVMDFGISFCGDLTRITRTGVMVGTPQYMAPEQFLDGVIDNHTDIYSVGIILFEVFTGALPFDKRNLAALMYAHANTPPPVPSALVPELPTELERIILRALEKDPNQRYQTAEELLEALKRIPYPVTETIKSSLQNIHSIVPPPIEKAETTQVAPPPLPVYKPETTAPVTPAPVTQSTIAREKKAQGRSVLKELLKIDKLTHIGAVLGVFIAILILAWRDTPLTKITTDERPKSKLVRGYRISAGPFPKTFPLNKGNYWIYRGPTSRIHNVSKENIHEEISWKMEVIDTIRQGNFLAAIVKEYPQRVTSYTWMNGIPETTKVDRENEKNRLDLVTTPDTTRYYRYDYDPSHWQLLSKQAATLDELSRQANVFLDLPLELNKRFGEEAELIRVDGYFTWFVEQIYKAPQWMKSSIDGNVYQIFKRTSYNYDLIEFSPGVGIVRYQYYYLDLHSVDVKLMEYRVDGVLYQRQ